jgi:Tol biopolymer transport system component
MKQKMNPLPLLAAATLVLANTGAAQTIELISTGVGGQSNGENIYPELTADGSYVAWHSAASNLVVGDTNDAPDCFVYRRSTGETIRVSVATGGGEVPKGGLEPVISFDNRWVTFYSFSTGLVPGDLPGTSDCFLHHIPTSTTTRMSEAFGGGNANGGSRYPVISYFGRYVAFESSASNLIANDTNGLRDVFVRDNMTGITTCVSTSATGVIGNGESVDAFISPEGRYVVFESDADNLVPGDVNGVRDCFMKDIQTGAITLISVNSAGEQGNALSQNPTVSENGLRVAFASDASNLVPMDANGYSDLFMRDTVSGITERLNVSSSGVQGHVGAYEVILSPDGGWAVFFSHASNHVLGDTNSVGDVFVRDFAQGTTERVSVGDLGQQGFGECKYPAISSGGRYISFSTASDNLVPGDTNMEDDIFVVDRYSPFSPFCGGDGSLITQCPCGNDGMQGRGCDNSSSTGGAALVASGSTEDDTVVFSSIGLPASTVTVVLQAQNDSSSPGISFGDGILCSTGAIKRLYIKAGNNGAISAPELGDPTVLNRSAALGDPLSPGMTRYYQVYYRDANAGFCTADKFNASNGVIIQW